MRAVTLLADDVQAEHVPRVVGRRAAGCRLAQELRQVGANVEQLIGHQRGLAGLHKRLPHPVAQRVVVEELLQRAVVHRAQPVRRVVGDPADIESEEDGLSDTDYPLPLVEQTAYPQRSALEPLLTVD